MTEDQALECAAVINVGYRQWGDELDGVELELFTRMFFAMEFEPAREAAAQVVLDSRYKPKFADVRDRYAEIIGRATGETPAQAMDRHKRQAQFRAKLAAAEEQRRELFRQAHPELASPEAEAAFVEECRQRILSRTRFAAALAGHNPRLLPEGQPRRAFEQGELDGACANGAAVSGIQGHAR